MFDDDFGAGDLLVGDEAGPPPEDIDMEDSFIANVESGKV